MRNLHIKQQIRRLYAVTTVEYFQIAGASWVALLALRGFTLPQIGILESIFHAVSLCFEIPSGVVADVMGRKKTLIASLVASLISSIIMILSGDVVLIALAIGINALSYNLASGTREALAYDSLKEAGCEEDYNRFASTEMMLYRITNSLATLCAGLALWLGYRKAYAIDVIFHVIALVIALGLVEAEVTDGDPEAELGSNGGDAIISGQGAKPSIREQLHDVIAESVSFLRGNHKASAIMIVNAGIGAVSTLILFFLQAKLPEAGLPNALLGPALFLMGMGAALGARMVGLFPRIRYAKLLAVSGIGVALALAVNLLHAPAAVLIIGGFVGAFFDDFLEVRTDVILNEMIPSGQRATLVSVGSFLFSVVMIFLSTIMGYLLG